MATNTLAPNGLVPSHNRRLASPTYQGNVYKIKKGYATAIGIGDVVQTSGPGASQGYVILAADNANAVLGVFGGVLGPPGYYDSTLQGTAYGLNGSWPATANPNADVSVVIIDDADMIFRVQLNGGPWTESMRGKNAVWTAATNGAPNASGISTLSADATTIAVNNTLPLRIVGLAGVTGGPQDPANTNPVILVTLNTAENLNPTGI